MCLAASDSFVFLSAAHFVEAFSMLLQQNIPNYFKYVGIFWGFQCTCIF